MINQFYANVTFPGIQRVVDFQGTLSHGITPSVFRLTIVPQAAVINQNGNLTITWTNLTTGSVDTLTFTDCIIDTSSMEYDASGALIVLSVLDRRWRWRFGKIAGRYNLRDANGNLLKAAPPVVRPGDDTERTPQQLATLCLQAMGETGYDVSAMPNETRPRAEWEWSNPSHQLADLCDDLHCRVVLKMDGTVKICRVGIGSDFPAGPGMSISTEINPPERPGKITVICGRTRFQSDFLLEPVGLDVDRKIRPIDKLSYKPAGGWFLAEDVEHFYANDQPEAELAKKSVFRWYQIGQAAASGLIQLPVFSSALNNIWCISDIQDEQNTLVTEFIEAGETVGVVRPRQPIVYGTWWRETDDDAANTNTGKPVGLSGLKDKQIVDRFWSYDHKRKIIKFSHSIYRMTANSEAAAPYLYYRCAYYACDPETRAWHHHMKSRDMRSTWGTTSQDELVVHQDHLVATYTANYTAGVLMQNNTPTWENNTSVINIMCDKYIDDIVSEIENRESGARTYAGLMLNGFDLDGAITQVSWQITTSGSTTKILKNTDPGSKTTIGYDERRIFERQRLHSIQLQRQRKVGDIEPQHLVAWE